MMNTVSLDELYTISGLLEQLTDRLQRLAGLQNSLRQEEPMLDPYPMKLTLRDLPPPWRGHTLGLVGAIWLLLVDIWGGGLFSGLIFLLCTFHRIRKLQSDALKLMYMAFSAIMALFVALVAFSKLMDGGTMSTIGILALASGFIAAALVMPARKKANRQIDEENEARCSRNEACKKQNEEIWQQIHLVSQQIDVLQANLEATVRSFNYPPDYVTMDAVGFFIRCVKNHRANTYQDMIDRYEEDQDRQRRLAEARKQTQLLQQQAYNQERMREQLAYTNMLQAAQIATQIRCTEEITSEIRTQSRLAYNYFRTERP